jgi:hypothetical protein
VLSLRPAPCHPEITIRREAIKNDVHHRMAVAEKVLPQKIAPAFAQDRIVEEDAALAMKVADHVVTTKDVVSECREKAPMSLPRLGARRIVTLPRS